MMICNHRSCYAVLTSLSIGLSALTAQETPVRTVRDNVLISPSLPPLAIKVDSRLTYLGAHPIRIRDVAAGERHVFAELDRGAVVRLIVMQFEGFLDGIDDEYRYDLRRSPVVAGFPFRSNGYAFDMVRARRDNPTAEAATTARFLEAQGIVSPRHWMMWRSLTIADVERRNELIIFYVEPGEHRGLTTGDLYVGGEATPQWRRIQGELEDKAHRSIELAPLAPGGEPRIEDWARIPTRGGD